MVRTRSNLGRHSRNARNVAASRASQSDGQRANNTLAARNGMARGRALRNPAPRPYVRRTLERAASNYDANFDYVSHGKVSIGPMTTACSHCKAFKFKHEVSGLCCSNGQVKLPELNPPPEPLHNLITGGTPISKHFLANIQAYNSGFQMTSFGATNIIRDNFMPTFKIQGQVYHRLGSLLPFPDQSYQFLQIYFVGNSNVETDRRCDISSNLRRDIIERLQNMLHAENELVRLFQTALDQMPSDEYAIVIRADKTPPGQHVRRFNAPTMDDVAIVIVGDEFNSRDTVLRRRNMQLQRVSETHRCYDGLQYPLLFCRGEDGYHFNIKMINPSTG